MKISYCLTALLILLCTTTRLFSQNNWTGTTNTAWNTASNWSAGVPDANDIVYIPNVSNNPTISTSNAVAKSVAIEAGGELTIVSTGTLTIKVQPIAVFLSITPICREL